MRQRKIQVKITVCLHESRWYSQYYNSMCYTFIGQAAQSVCLHRHHHKHVSNVLHYNITTATMSLGTILLHYNVIGTLSYMQFIIDQKHDCKYILQFLNKGLLPSSPPSFISFRLLSTSNKSHVKLWKKQTYQPQAKGSSLDSPHLLEKYGKNLFRV